MPATFFVVGRVLEETPDEFRRLFDDPLFEVASHGWSHRVLMDHPTCGAAPALDGVREEIERGVESVARIFAHPCRGFRPACGYPNGLRGQPELLGLLSRAGVRYVSSVLWGEDYSLPALVRQTFVYAEEGCPALREIPAHGWHENLLKGNNRIFGQGARRTVLFPAPFPEAVPPRYVATPEEEFRYNNRFFIDRALAERSGHLTLIWHPWSLALFDPDLRMLELTFRYVREQGLEPATFGSFDEQLRG
jgi:peptidoglycan/xylan/chitin deacetylase (PgdA/CDA1 family)